MPSHRQTLSYLMRRFQEAGLQPDSRHGQNFLIDLNLLDILTGAADLGPEDVVLEIGTGLGSLTARLAGTPETSILDAGREMVAAQPDQARVRRRLEEDPQLLARGPMAVLYGIIDEVVDEYEPVVVGLENDIDEIENQLFANDPAVARRIFGLTREVNDFQRAVGPLAQMMLEQRAIGEGAPHDLGQEGAAHQHRAVAAQKKHGEPVVRIARRPHAI